MPDTGSIFARIMGKRWWFYIPEEHLTYFHPASIERLYRQVGLEPVRTDRATKPLTLTYGLTQFKEYNPLIYKTLKALFCILPVAVKNTIIPFYIGEMQAIARAPRS